MTDNLKTDETAWMAWIRLMQTDGVGSDTACRLLSVFGLPHHIFQASFMQLQEVVSERIAQLLLTPPTDYMKSLMEATQEWLKDSRNSLLTLADAHYPPMLLQIPDPPPLLYVKGRASLLSEPAIAIVGSRNASQQGVADAGRFAQALSQTGYTIVSGMALGIDSAAHEGGLRGNGSTIAVIGTGQDIVYPARNHQLAHHIAEVGCIVSEYPLGTAALPHNFPRRNRIISGLSRGILVVEAAAKSGSLITARLAAEQGREVFAIPGSIHSPLSRGCHQLIRQGAKLVESAQDILEDLAHYQRMPKADPVESDQADDKKSLEAAMMQLLDALGFDPVDMDVLVMRTGMEAAELQSRLLALEFEGQVEKVAGGKYRRLVI